MLKINKDYKLSTNFNLHFASETKPYLYPKLSRFELYQSEKNKRYYWKLKATNGRVILRCTKGYENKNSAIENIIEVCQYGTDSDNFEPVWANVQNGGYTFRLQKFDATKNKMVNLAINGNGKFYTQKENRDKYNIALLNQVLENGVNKGIHSVIANLQSIIQSNKPILDFTV